jgi:peptidoglycan hydrolase CwlO-like protein
MLSNLHIILIIIIFLIIVLGYIQMNKSSKNEGFEVVTNAQMQSALNNANSKLTDSVSGLDNLQNKFKNLDKIVSDLLKTQTSDIEKLKKSITENERVIKLTDQKLTGKFQTLYTILSGKLPSTNS